ncbi:transposase [Epilithonimonas sp.]|uniref:transposase n=1 Tax=Epilithonimonas sp. TaxID=2894511 RepID=UPI00289D0D6D|nr:transposase [Epilithonimonas sp.]
MILFGYVIMSNHIHLIVQSKDGNLSELIRDFKKFTSKNCRSHTDRAGKRKGVDA